jgi:serine/threonine-protein kinase
MKRCPKCQKQFDDALGFCPQDGTVLEADHGAMVGRVLDGQYEIEAFIAAGGMGAVYRARHILLGDRVAIKILPIGMQQNDEWLKRFQREGQAARRFRHPNAVVVHDLRTSSEGLIYLVMELVEGTTLEQMQLERERFSPAESLPIIEAVASVLDAAHAQGVVHRDLKPSNIMITRDGTVKLLDLGIAKIRDAGPDQTGLTTEGQFLGTPYFMSPEQWGEIPRDGGHEIDGRADVYSLGVVVYQLTAGALPFRGATAAELRRAHISEPAPSLSLAGTNAPPAWNAAVMRAMSKDRADRQSSAGQFARELAGISLDAGPREAARSTAPTLLNTDTPMTGGAVTGADTTGAVPATLDSTAAGAPKRSWTVSLLHNRGCQVTFTVAAMLVIGVAVGIPLLLNYTKDNATRNGSTANSNKAGGPTPKPTDTPGNKAFATFHLLVATGPFETPTTSSPDAPIPGGQIVQFAVTPTTKGYLYLFGHDDQGKPVAVPADPIAGHSYIELSPGTETSIPSVPLLKLKDQPGEEVFTLVISEKPLIFDQAESNISLRPLTSAELAALNSLRNGSPAVSLTSANTETQVRLPGAKTDAAVVFNVRLRVVAH